MKNFRCPKCNKLAFNYELQGSLIIELKCSRCNSMIKTIINN